MCQLFFIAILSDETALSVWRLFWNTAGHSDNTGKRERTHLTGWQQQSLPLTTAKTRQAVCHPRQKSAGPLLPSDFTDEVVIIGEASHFHESRPSVFGSHPAVATFHQSLHHGTHKSKFTSHACRHDGHLAAGTVLRVSWSLIKLVQRRRKWKKQRRIALFKRFCMNFYSSFSIHRYISSNTEQGNEYSLPQNVFENKPNSVWGFCCLDGCHGASYTSV